MTRPRETRQLLQAHQNSSILRPFSDSCRFAQLSKHALFHRQFRSSKFSGLRQPEIETATRRMKQSSKEIELWMTFRNNYIVSSAIRSSRRLLTNDEPKPRSRSKFAGQRSQRLVTKGFGQEGRLQPAGGISRRTSRSLTAVTSSHRRRLGRRRCRRFGSTQSRVGYFCYFSVTLGR